MILLTFQRRMEEKAAGSDQQIANESHQEDAVVVVSQAVVDALECEIHE